MKGVVWPAGGMPWAGHYISRGSKEARRRSIEAELRDAGVAAFYSRFELVEPATIRVGKTGLTSAELGALWSHHKVIETDHPGDLFVHVLEDNAVLARSFRPVVEQFIQRGSFAAFDLIFTDLTINTPPLGPVHSLKAAYAAAKATAPDVNFGLINLRGLNFTGAASYFINPASLGKIRDILRRECAPDTASPSNMDMLYRREVDAGRLNAGCVFPFVSSIDLNLAGLSAVIGHPVRLKHELLRTEFYVDSDVELLSAALDPNDQPKGTGPVAVLSYDPPVFKTGIAYDEFLGIAPSFGEKYGDVPAGFLIYPTWSIEGGDRAASIAEAAWKHLDKYPSHRLAFLANTQREADLLAAFDQPVTHLNKNFTVSDTIFRPLPEAMVEFDAIYNARFVPLKRHELAAGIGRVAYLGYVEGSPENLAAQRTRLAEILAENPGHALLNPLSDGFPVRLTPEDTNAALNRAGVGLCLSPVEGSNYASMEYMLAGLPVVSTPSQGGRDVFFDPEYCIVCEPDPSAVRDAVEDLRARKIPRDYVRARTLARIEPDRRRFLAAVDDLIGSLGGRRRYDGPWPFGKKSGMITWDTFQSHLIDFDRVRFATSVAAETGLDIVKDDVEGVQLHATELRPIVAAITARPGCSLLVFGCGRDSVFWEKVNRGGTTAFLEDNPEWLELARSGLTWAQAHLVDYGTRRQDWGLLMDSPARLTLDLPPAVSSRQWDVVLVDGPAGYEDDQPGRMKSIYMASRLVAAGGCVFVHDCDRQVERDYAERWLGARRLFAEAKGRALLRGYAF